MTAPEPRSTASTTDLKARVPSGARCLEGTWYLEGTDEGPKTWRTQVRKLPFHIGRGLDADLVLHARGVSWRHASLFLQQRTLCLRDLESTNGTFLNGERISSNRPLRAGDVIYFANQGCRLMLSARGEPKDTTQEISRSGFDLDPRLFKRQLELCRLIRHRRLKAAFQPVLRLEDGAVVGYELLGRCELESREISPRELFEVASTLGLESELSTAFRDRGVRDSKALPGDPVVFLNTHPAELKEVGRLVASLEQLRCLHPDAKLVLEIHAAAVADTAALRAMHSQLSSLDIGLAFDDFGVGQTRLLELIEASPHYVKFDRVWIKGLHRASRMRREMVETLVGLMRKLDVATVAEGVETAEEASACSDLGFGLAQGYYFGRPGPGSSFTAGP